MRKGRYSQSNGIYLVTTVTDQRIPWFKDLSLAKIICQLMEDPAGILDSTNLCWVVMPDHVHLLLQLGNSDLSRVVRQLKARSALKLNQEIGRSGPFWFSGFHDIALRKEEDLRGVALCNVAGHPAWEKALVARPPMPKRTQSQHATFHWDVELDEFPVVGTVYPRWTLP